MAAPPSGKAPIPDEKALPYTQKKNFEPSEADETKRTARGYIHYNQVLPALLTLLALLTFFRSAFVSDHHSAPTGRHGLLNEIDEGVDKPKVELEAHGMSRCPDFRDCLRELILPTMERVSDRVNFTLSFIGQYASSEGFQRGAS